MNKDLKPEELIKQKMAEVQTNLSHQDYFNHYILETLDSFAFRYFDQASPAVAINNNNFSVTAIELGIKEAIKNKNPELRAGITELVKRVSKAEGPTILRELKVTLNRGNDKGGSCHVSARISFGHPEHNFSKGTFVESVDNFKFEDDIHFRNTLARHLEAVCELF